MKPNLKIGSKPTKSTSLGNVYYYLVQLNSKSQICVDPVEIAWYLINYVDQLW